MSYTLDQLIENGGGFVHQDTLEQARSEVNARDEEQRAVIQSLQAERDRLSEALMELANLVDDMRDGTYVAESFTTQPARRTLEETKS